jgi:tRNA threonylcarbamoyladenosine biosynthesis protein TsaB
MATVLAVDTSAEAGSAALSADGEAPVVETWSGGGPHSAHLVQRIDVLLRRAGLGLGRVDLLAACVGPGSYTGLRVGLAAVAGLRIVAGIRAVGISALQAFAWTEAPARAPMLAVRNGFRRDLFCQLFDGDAHAVSQPALVALDALGAFPITHGAPGVVVGDPGDEARALLARRFGTARFAAAVSLAPVIARRAAAFAAAGAAVPLVPLYIRPVDIGVPRAR